MPTKRTEPIVGVDIGGSGIKGAPVDLDLGEFAAERIRIPTPIPSTPEAVADVVARVVDGLGVAGPIGLTLPSVVQGGVVRTAANIDKTWLGVDAANLFHKATGRSVVVLNDADAAGLAEVRFGAGANHPGVIMMVTLGTGIGSALFVEGRLVPNTELGHLHLHHHGEAESWAADSVREREGLPWREFAVRLADYVNLLRALFWPDLVIIGGGVSRKADKFLPLPGVDVDVLPAELQNDAGIIGAAMMAQELA
jgi:polyphosphate glucokinase